MTPQDHNRIIGIMHLIYGGFNAMMMLIFVPIFLIISAGAASDPNTPTGLAPVFGFFSLLMIVLAVVLGLPSILAGYAMLRQKSWARVMSIIAACVGALSFPFGTALCVYTFWFLFGEGRNFHGGGGQMSSQGWQQSPHLRDAQSTYDWEAQRAQQSGRQREYVPPPQPPDWRG